MSIAERIDGPARPAARFDFTDPLFLTDPWPLYEWHRRHEPVHWSEPANSYVVVGYENVRRTLTSTDFSVYHPFRSSRRAFGPSMLDSEGPRAASARRATSRVLRPREVGTLAQEVIAPIAAELLDEMVADRVPDLADRLAWRLPMRVVCRVMGLPEADADLLYDLMRPLVRYVDHEAIPLAEVTERRQQIREYLLAARARGQGHGGMLDALAAEEELREPDVVNNAILLLAAGTETTAAAIINLFARVAVQPGLYRSLADDRDQVPAVVNETLRHEPPLHMTLRFTTRPVELAGVDLPTGAPVQACLASANRDPSVYPDPHVWRLREGARTPLTFGAGRHVCAGMGLAQAELEVVLNSLLDRVTDLAVAGEPPETRGRTFRHPVGMRLTYRPRGGGR